MTSNLIKGMINNLLHEQGNGFDKTIFSNLQKTNKFSPKIIRPNCLTSLFLLDVNKSPIDGFIKVRNDQEGYGDKAQKKVLLADAYNLENCFDDKNIKKNYGKKDQLLKRFIYAIENHCGGFDQKFGNSLFVQSLKNVDNAIPNENFVVQLLAGISDAKIKAKDDKDIKELLKIEEACKPLVYYSLDKFVCPFKTQKEIQNRVMDYFGRTNTAANDYFRQLGIANIIKTKLADDGLINIDYNNINNKNSMIYIDITGNQSFLIDNNDPNANVEPNANITNLIKKCKLIENGSVSRNSKYIQKALNLINKEVVKSNDTKDDKKDFLQTALTFLILMDVQDVKDPFDYVGIAIANPISDILTLMQDNQAELNRLFMNSFRTANNIVKREQGKTLNNRYFEQIQAVSTENKEELINVAQINVPNENDNVKNNNNNEENISDDANNTVSVPSNNNVSGNTSNSTPVIKNNAYIKPKDYISHNIKYYEKNFFYNLYYYEK